MSPPLFQKILIANRGEIAVRIARACQELGITSVAVYSEADREALHVRVADEAHLIGPAPAAESYLSIANLLNAARESRANAIHPGYGFLSENAEFAQAVKDAGIVFIGPSPEAIRVMGDKVQARRLMQAGSVPVVPGYQESTDDASLERAAQNLGYPILIKAAAGGGGKAMRVVSSREELEPALGAARREAEHAFGDSRLFLEKYIGSARHIEFQILADRFGNIVHLFERECSIQRRHQKIIEETPSPLLDDDMRSRMGAAAVEAARRVGYENAGTVEFIVDPETRQFYFLEMNTRLQVEHPITEVTTGIDLVQHQIQIAAGLPLRLSQSDIAARGHAIECRIYAEDPTNGFLPATGCLRLVKEPNRPGVRLDSGFGSGDQVTVHYDPLLSKLIASAETREAAIIRMQTALRDYIMLGVMNNIEFLQAVLAHPEFQKGRATTTFIDDHLSDWQPEDQPIPPQALIAAALSVRPTVGVTSLPSSVSDRDDPYSPWRG